MRIATLKALGKAGYLGLLSLIEQEGLVKRQAPDEQAAVCEYLKQLVEGTAKALGSQYLLSTIELILDDYLESGLPLSSEVIAVAKVISNSKKLQARLAYFAFDGSLTPEIRAEIIMALNVRRGDPLLGRIRQLLDQGLAEMPASPITRACADRMASILPEELLDLKHPVIDAALWNMSLKLGWLTFADRILDPTGSSHAPQQYGPSLSANNTDGSGQGHSENRTDRNTAQELPKNTTGCLWIKRWGELGIGVTADRNCFAFTPCPNFGQQVTLAEGVPLVLPDGQWQRLLDCLIESPDGRTVTNEELLTALKLNLKSGKSSKSAKHHQGLRHVTDVRRRQLQSAMANLAKQFRIRVCTDRRLPVFESHGDSYRAAFVARCLLRDEQRHYRFGDPR